MTTVELVGGPNDGIVIDVKPEQLFARLEFEELRHTPGGAHRRLLDGETVPAAELERPDVIVHTYSRTERTHDGALIYRYVRP